jgi:hypothetical protein
MPVTHYYSFTPAAAAFLVRDRCQLSLHTCQPLPQVLDLRLGCHVVVASHEVLDGHGAAGIAQRGFGGLQARVLWADAGDEQRLAVAS